MAKGLNIMLATVWKIDEMELRLGRVKDLSGVSVFQERVEMGWQDGRLNKRIPLSSYNAMSWQT